MLKLYINTDQFSLERNASQFYTHCNLIGSVMESVLSTGWFKWCHITTEQTPSESYEMNLHLGNNVIFPHNIYHTCILHVLPKLCNNR